jgi:hypothetical protein
MAQQPKKRKRKVKRKVRITQKARIQKKDSVSNDTLRQDTLRKAPFIINDNGLNMRIKIKRKSR